MCGNAIPIVKNVEERMGTLLYGQLAFSVITFTSDDAIFVECILCAVIFIIVINWILQF